MAEVNYLDSSARHETIFADVNNNIINNKDFPCDAAAEISEFPHETRVTR
jgi:hypothetical protein